VKFKLTQKSEVQVKPLRTEERYHYESEDGSIRVLFNAGDDPWTWEIIGNASRPMAMRLIEKFVEKGMDKGPDQTFDDAIKELEIA
jgi:hypothetical protein